MNDLIPAAIHHTGRAMLAPDVGARVTCFRRDGRTILTIESGPDAPSLLFHLTPTGLAALAALLAEAIEAHKAAAEEAHVG